MYVGSELRSWIFFYALPVLNGILLPYFKNCSLFVASMHILMSDRIHEEDLELSSGYLRQFYRTYMELYGKVYYIFIKFKGEKNCTMNIHLITHVTDCVRDWGPLWAYTCFPFESANNNLKKLFHGTKNMSKQVSLF